MDIQLDEYGYLFIILMFTKRNEHQHGCACFRGDQRSFALILSCRLQGTGSYIILVERQRLYFYGFRCGN